MKDAIKSPVTVAKLSPSGGDTEGKLPRRDWILLPMICLLTIGFIGVSTELIARRVFYRPPSTSGRCITFKDPSVGFGAIPNTVCRTLFDGKWMEYRFNSCGFRTDMECGPKTPGTYRIVMTGSSTAMGLGVPSEQSFAALLPTELSQITGRRVELYNESVMAARPETIARWFNEVLDAQPDLILWVVTPYDVQIGGAPPAREPDPTAGPVAKALFEVKNRPPSESIADALRDVWLNYARTAVLLRHGMDASRSQFLKSYLMGDDIAGFMKTEPSGLWQSRLQRFDSYAASIAAQAKAGNVPFAVVLLPVRAQVAMISMGESLSGYDPYKLDNELRVIVSKHGGIYMDILPHFDKVTDLDQIYQSADEHPNEKGHAVISRLLAAQLTSGAIPALGVPSQLQAARKQDR